MDVTRRDLLKGAAMIGLGGTLSRPEPTHAQTTQKRELVTAQGGDIAKLDPHFSTNSNEIRVSFNLFDNLTSRHPDGKLYPGLATEWKLEGQTTWRSSCARASSSTTATRSPRPTPSGASSAPTTRRSRPWWPPSLTTIDHIEAPDPYTLVIHTKKPDPLLPARLAFYGGQIVPKKYVEAVGNDTFNAKPVGTGPVRFVSWAKDDQARARRQPGLLGRQIDVDRLDHAARSPRRRRASPRCSRARSTSSPSCRPTRASG